LTIEEAVWSHSQVILLRFHYTFQGGLISGTLIYLDISIVFTTYINIDL